MIMTEKILVADYNNEIACFSSGVLLDNTKEDGYTWNQSSIRCFCFTDEELEEDLPFWLLDHQYLDIVKKADFVNKDEIMEFINLANAEFSTEFKNPRFIEIEFEINVRKVE